MREIKFRAWDKSNEQYNYFHTHKRGLQYSCGRLFVSTGWDGEDNPVYEKDNIDVYVIEQYTGLKDKNEKEIYEGDICRWVSTEGTAHTWPIVWDEKNLCFCHNNMPFAQLFDSGYYQPPREWPSGLEVIGNIHENKELLK